MIDHRIKVPICSYQVSSTSPLFMVGSTRRYTPHGALALAAEVADGILGPGTRRLGLKSGSSWALKKQHLKNVTFMCPAMCQTPILFMEYCCAKAKNSADGMSLGPKLGSFACGLLGYAWIMFILQHKKKGHFWKSGFT